MRVLFVSRLMSGFAESVRTGVWRPTGAPAVHRMMDALAARAPAPRFVLLQREAGFDFAAPWVTARDVELTLQGLPAPVKVLAGAYWFPQWLGRVRGHLAELRQLLAVLVEIRRTKPEVIYFERGGAAIAGIVARLYPHRVVLRVLGVLPWMQSLDRSRGLYHRLLRFAYRAPFGLVICSEDGSGGRDWMRRYLRSGVPRLTLLNGVGPLPPSAGATDFLAGIRRDAVVIVSVGRLEGLRRLDEIVEAMLRLPETEQRAAHLLIVGDGPLRAALQAQVEAAGAEALVTFAGAQTAAGVSAALARADIYVMLNDMCCLTNTTLEALRAGLCMVVLDPPPPVDTDPATDELLPPDLAVRLPRGDRAHVVDALTSELAALIASPDARARRRGKAASMADAKLTDWQTRISREIALLERIARGERLPEPVDG